MNLILKTIQFKTIESEMKFLFDNGYVNEDGRPLKCVYCNETEIGRRNEQYMEHGLCEFEAYCKKCNESIGYWSYGYWQV
jgi:hypothetical protein